MRCKIDFQDGDYLGFLIGMILAIFYLQVSPILPTKIQVIWPFGSGEDLQDGSHLGFPMNDLILFYSTSCPIIPTKSRVN